MKFKAVDDQLKLVDAASGALAQIKKYKYISELKSNGANNTCAMWISSPEKL